MDEDNNPDLNLTQLGEKFESKKEGWVHFDDEYGWTFNDWVEGTQHWKDIPKVTKDKFLLRQHSHYWEHTQQAWILSQVQNICLCFRHRWAASLTDKT
jgi:hypothetical protein